MQKIFKKILIPFFILAIFFGGFSFVHAVTDRITGLTQAESDAVVNKCGGNIDTADVTCLEQGVAALNKTPEQKAAADAATLGISQNNSGQYQADCSKLTGDAAQNCASYNRLNQGKNVGYVDVTNQSTGEVIRISPDGSTVTYQNNRSNVVTGTYDSATDKLSGNTTANTAQTESSNVGGVDWGKMLGKLFSLSDAAGAFMTTPVFAAISAFLYLLNLILSLAVYLFAALFDGMVTLSILRFKEVVDASGITVGWGIIRNFINIAFIFILLYISISIILGSFGPKKKTTVASVIIAALLVNFSLFFTRIFIDAGNYLAVALAGSGLTIGKFSTLIMAGISAPGIFKMSNLTVSGQAGTLLLLTFQITILAVLLWAFISATFLFLGRMIMLIVLMTLSPIGFIGDSIPWLKDKAEEWRSALTGQILVAPVFLFFMVLVGKLSEQAPTIKALGEGVWGSNFALGPLIYYSIIIAMLITGVKMTKKLSGEVGSFVEKAVNAAVAAALAVVTGGAMLGAGKVVGGIARLGGGKVTDLALNASMSNNRVTRFIGNRALGTIDTARSAVTGTLTKQPGMLGFMAKNTQDLIKDNLKKQTGVDLGWLKKNQDERQKFDEKVGTDWVNELGGKKESEQLETLKKINTNIESQAKDRATLKYQSQVDDAKKIQDEGERKNKLAEVNKLIDESAKTTREDIAREMGQKDGYKGNEEKIAKLQVEIINKQPAKNQAIAKIKSDKLRNKLSAQKGVLKITDETRDLLKKLNKQIKEAKIDLPSDEEEKPAEKK